MKLYTKLSNILYKYSCTSMDDLRYEMYHQSKVSDLYSLPPTSADLYLYILRCLYMTFTQMHCRQKVTVDPTNYGYGLKNGSLVPIYHQNNLKESLVQTCTVKPVLSGHSIRRQKMVLKTDCRFMQIKSIAECSKRAFCNTFDLH